MNLYVSAFWEGSGHWLIAFIMVCIVVVLVNLLFENRRRERLYKELTETSNSLNAAIEIANMVFFEYYPEQHRAIGLSEYDPLNKEREFLGYPDSWFAKGIMHPDDRGGAKRLFERIDGGAEYAEQDIRYWYQGTYHWFRYRMKSVYDLEGKRIKVICTRMDVTYAKEIEDGYQQNLNALFTANPNTLVSCRLDLMQDKVSKCYTMQNELRNALLNANTIDDAFIKMAGDIHTEDDKEKYLQIFSSKNLIEQCKNGKNLVRMSYQCMIEKELHWIDAFVEMVMEPQNQEIDAVYQEVDITYNRILELLLESSANHDYDSLAFIYGNSQRFTRYSWMYHKDLVMQEQYHISLLQELSRYPIDDFEEIKKSLQWNVILEHLNRDGEYTLYFTQYHGTGIKRRKRLQFFYIDRKEQLILGSQRDITDVFENEAKQKEALAIALQEAKAANRAKTDFLSRMSHDMRTPMNAIIGITALALDETDNPELTMQNLKKISSASQFLLSLINDILDMTKIEDGAVELHLEPYHYADFIGNLHTLFESLSKENGIQLIFEKSPQTDKTLLVDKVRINQIFFNILSNAIKFTPEGGSVIYREENFSVEGNWLVGDYVIIDNGIGMSREFQKNLFQPFVQEDNKITSKIQGTGLGLSITKSLVELMGGTIRIDSEEGKGTKVTIHLSLEIVASMQEEDVPAGSLLSEESLEGKRILLVEDHPLNTEIAKRLLNKKRMQVTCAENGRAALESFIMSEPGFFDAILMDIRMPVMDGLTATRKIRALERPDAGNIPIIAMTANAYAEDVRLTKEAGMDEHLAKPIEPEKLYHVLLEKIS